VAHSFDRTDLEGSLEALPEVRWEDQPGRTALTFPFPLMRSSEEEALESPRADERPLAKVG
jgi:hypothetical protein